MNFDTRIFYDINHFACATPWPRPIVSGYARTGWCSPRCRWPDGGRPAATPIPSAAMWAPLGMLAALGVNQPVAAAVSETRPCRALHDIVVLLAAIAAAAIAFARVYIGTHYPQDVLAGLTFGAAVSLAGYVLLRPLLGCVLEVVGGTPLRVLIAPPRSKLLRYGNSRDVQLR